ncbi:MAG: thiamine phosphate synthase [Planctomycetota bacterium]
MDANANRAREALRVIEDVSRFVWDDAWLSAQLKEVRHGLRLALAATGIAADRLVEARDSVQDVGRDRPASDERSREDLRAVLTANFRRAGEALRVLEEMGKLVSPDAGAPFEKLRYRLYDLEKRLLMPADLRRKLNELRLYVLLSPEQAPGELVEIASRVLEGGADAVQLRMKSAGDSEVIRVGRRIADLSHGMDKLFLLNDRPDLAVAAGADGVHLGQDDVPIETARRILPGHAIVGLSTHSLEEALDAQRRGADYIAVGPVFQTPIKGARPPLGVARVTEILSALSAPRRRDRRDRSGQRDGAP